jgi:FkbM family methyltransferase
MQPGFVVRSLLVVARHTPLGRGGLRRTLTAFIASAHKAPLDTTFQGVPIRLRMDNTTERKALFGRYDLRELQFIAQFVQRPGSVFIDIGANSGLYTVYVSSRIGTGSKIIAIEPNPKMIERLEHNLSMSESGRIARRVEVSIERTAVGARNEAAFLDVPNGYGTAHLIANDSQSAIKVSVQPLLDIVRRHRLQKIDALKIDIEGHEDRALLPFFAAAPTSLHPRAMVMEFNHGHAWQADLIGRCEGLGYRTVAKTRGNILLAR